MEKKDTKNASILAVGVVALLLVVVMIVTSGNDNSPAQYYTSKEAQQSNETDSAKKEKSKIDKAKAQYTFDSLKNNFIVYKDDFNNITWYTHKTFGKNYPNRRTIYTEVRNDGYYNVHSNYYNNDWVFHTAIRVLVGSKQFSTEQVESYEENNRRDNEGGAVWENITYDAVNADILKAIADSINLPAKIRFLGSKHYDDAIIPQKDKLAIKESLKLAEALRILY